ncbi:MAG: DNA repair protein RadC [Bacteroidaceae bacterium]|nr:DNA repair protein RadC [Bacteroidaceae bacterium]
MLNIKELSADDRPREKLLAKGSEALSKAELLAILIGSGSATKNAVELMVEVLRDCDDRLILLNRLSVEELMKYKGIGEAKAITLKAAMELGRRRAQEEALTDLKVISTAQQIYEYMHADVRELTHEESWVFLLNNSSRLIKRVRLSQGGRTETSVDVRILLRHALLAEATSVILVHNHPSGSCRPSQEDNRLTERVNQACRAVNIRLIDHVIVTDGDYYSFSENGKL